MIEGNLCDLVFCHDEAPVRVSLAANVVRFRLPIAFARHFLVEKLRAISYGHPYRPHRPRRCLLLNRSLRLSERSSSGA